MSEVVAEHPVVLEAFERAIGRAAHNFNRRPELMLPGVT